MDVYLVPVGPDRYECYYEAAEQEETDEPVEGRGFFARMRAKFNEQLKEAERARHHKAVEQPTTFLGRMQKRSLRWIAERIADQRLLWHLRKVDAATLHASSDLATAEADRIMRSNFKWDADHHRNRLILHSLALIAAVPVALVPGPNVLGYLFTFTVVGHFLAWRGAVKGLHQIAWTIEPSPALTELRGAFSLDAAARHRVISDVAHRLHMPRMARFVEQIATVT
jgi:Mitochondrial K+-H+ exchange-related